MKRIGVPGLELGTATGGSGTSNYNDLDNKPQIAGTTLSGNNSLDALGVAAKNHTHSQYVEKVTGKGLSTNDYTNGDKGIVEKFRISDITYVVDSNSLYYILEGQCVISSTEGFALENNQILLIKVSDSTLTHVPATIVRSSSNHVILTFTYQEKMVRCDLSETPWLPVVTDISDKQDKLIAGTGITIAEDGKTISSTGGDRKADVDKLEDITSNLAYTQDTLDIVDDVLTPVPDYEALPLLCGQPPILFGAGTPQEAVVPTNWKQYDPVTNTGYQWNGQPSAVGQQYINTSASSGGRYIAVADANMNLTWKNF